MPFAHGKNTTVMLDGLSLSPYFRQADVALEADTADTTAFQSAWKTAIAGANRSKADLQGMYDPAVIAFDDLIGDDPSLVAGVLTIAQGATAIGDGARLLSIVQTQLAQSSPVGGVVGIKWSVLGSTAAGMGWVLHPLAEDTNTTTGAERDDGAASASGWSAHLHVTAVDAGSWVIKLQDAAVSNTYSDVTGGAFTAKTAAGGQRLLSANGTTALRRYVRYVATRTGGSAGDGITFLLAYSRN
jgi:hypothetical protein